ncbi:nickel-dependent lactate racemase [Tepidanaerobacter syntrophicus]|uniref:nickel-dependent lactate racemase n=1 Tax=Tepidanaerobacter syntrophicus TaxID=224999 RepID=UPI001BD41F31|nr:nickel-dependent lactate racemase [Tepidanaerobacter syntrophicus]
MELRFGYDTGEQIVDIPEKNLLGVLIPNPVEYTRTGAPEVQYSLEHPICSGRLEEIIKPGEKTTIITSDITRPMPTDLVMPLLLDELYKAGLKPEDLTLVYACGIHRMHTLDERKKLAGESVFSQIRCIDADTSNWVHMGITTRGTPVNIVKEVAEAEKRICLGNIEYHYFAGYSGGAKAIMPGVSTREAVQSNHSLMVEPLACAGVLEGNPVREDIEEAGNICKIDFILNVVLDEHKKIIRAVAGHPIKAHREGCAFLDKLYLKEIPKKADIILVSPGGAPKDLNLYQTQKALDNAKYAVKDGGVIILIGSCKEGLGDRTFEEWITQSPNPHSIVERIRYDFQLGGHKAAAIAMVLEKADIYLVSELPDDLVRNIFLTPQPSAQAALNAAFAKLGKDATILAMPYGSSTLPRVKIRRES